jgi:hypothetical protein
MSFVEFIGKNQTFHKHQAFDYSPKLGILLIRDMFQICM